MHSAFRGFVSLAGLLTGFACRSPAPAEGPAEAGNSTPTLRQAIVTHIDLKLGDVDGLSGLTVSGDGALWTVPERNPVLLRIGAHGIDRRVPIAGVPDDLDLEALAWLETGRFAVGTESNVPRDAELILLVEVVDDRAAVVDRIAIPYAELPIQTGSNHGIEGLCAVEGHLLAAFEQVVDGGSGRSALIVHRSPDGALENSTVSLTTPEGKISALECRRSPTGFEVIAIERHFGVHRIVTFGLPWQGSASNVEARVVVALEGLIASESNPEGITWSDGGFVLVVDNYYGTRRGPNELLRVVPVVQ